MRNRLLIVLLAGLVAVTLAGCKRSAKGVALEPGTEQTLEQLMNAPDSTVVGTVNGIDVTKGEVVRALWLWNAPSTLQDILNQKMIEQAAKKAGVTFTDKDLEEKVQESLKRLNVSSVDQLLAQFKVTRDRFMSGTRVSGLAEKTVEKQVKVTDAEYAEWIKASHILIKFPAEEKDQAKKEEIAKKKADEIYQKIKDGGDFAKLADEYSQDEGNIDPATGEKKGGDLGWFSKGRMVQDFEKKAFSMKAGEVSEPVKSFYGYHIIKVDKLGKDATPEEKVALNKMILERKIPMEMGKWFQGLQAESKVENLLMPPPVKEPTPVMRPQPPNTAPHPAPKMEAPKTAPAPPAKTEKPAAPPAGEKPETPPPPPPPTPAPAN